MLRKSSLKVLALVGLILVFAAKEKAQTAGPSPVITQAIDENRLVTLAGNTRPEANRKNDLGPVSSDLHLDMYLQLKRSPRQDLAAQQFVESLTDKASPNFHKWITAAEYGQRFGAAREDIATVSRWLESHGFTVNNVPSNNMVIDFSGSAGQVREALHTEIHTLEVAGQRYFANMSDPQIPAALLPAVTGVASLNNFRPRPMLVPRAEYTINSQELALVPGDLATIYNLNPAFSGGYTGQGQTIVVLEDSDLYNGTGDWNVFRQTFGLAQFPYASLTVVHPAFGAGGACIDPGVNSDDAEAAIDSEWSSAAAPNAAIIVASCADTTIFGGFIALQNLLTNGGPLPSVVSISYGESETEDGAALNSYINTLYQTAAAAGVSVFVSSGDSGAAASDFGPAAVFGIGVSGWASTIYNVAAGGTDFGDTVTGTTQNFWNSTNGTYYNSAKSYVPEIPWNDSCGSLITAIFFGFTTTYGPTGFCNAFPSLADTVAAGGGPSGCATGARSDDYVVSGTCAGYAKPSWQSIFGNPNDGVRDLPDIALFASNGFWGHYYVVCISDQASCAGPPSTWAGYGGTSFSSPIMAGIQALINQALGEKNVGNPNPVYYQIGQNVFSTSAGRTACNSTTGPASTCAFNDVTQGDMVLPCAGAINCFLDGEAIGALSTSNISYAPAYAAAPGWDFATGIGSVNAFNLLNDFVNSIASSSPPLAPVLVSPANGATGVLPAPTLTWNASARATSYDVYFGTWPTPPLVANTPNPNYPAGTLSPSTTYYWAVGARNNFGASVSTPWSFTTSCVSALNPSSATAPAAGGTGTIPVTATMGCGWTAVSNVPWIAITSGASGNGNGSVGYTVAAGVGSERVGTITIAGQTFTVTQEIYSLLISTLAGGALPPTEAPGASVSIPVSYGVAVDSSGNTYFPSPNLSAVFKADPAGLVTRIVGSGVSGYSGDGGPALSAQLNTPNGVAVDSLGNLYIADSNNHRIRKVGTNGVITTVAGNGNYGYSGDGGAATSAELEYPVGVAVDSAGNFYVADSSNHRVRKVTAAGIVTTLAGTGIAGYSGDNGAATAAELNYPYGVAVGTSGNLYIADSDNNRVRMVSSTGIITTVAGNGVCCGYSGDGGPATSAQLNYPTGVAVDAAGDLYIADSANDRVRKVISSGAIITVAGNGVYGYLGDGGAATNAELESPEGLTVDSAGNLYITDTGNARIRKVNQAGTIATLVGGAIDDGGLSVFGLLNKPSSVARDNAGNTYIADQANNRVRKVAANGTIATFAGTGLTGFSGDGGPAIGAQLNTPQGVALDAAGDLYIADTSNLRVRKVNGSGTITTVAGNGICCGYTGDGGAAINAQIGIPSAVAVDASGNLYISDVKNNVIRKVSASGTIATVAGNGTGGYAGDGGAATAAELNGPNALAVSPSGNLYIADSYNSRVRMVSASGIIITVAGTGAFGYSGDGGPATSAQLSDPAGVAFDTAGDLFISDSENQRIREVSTSGVITTVAGSGAFGYSGDGGPATLAAFEFPYGISVDAAGNVAVADLDNNAVRLLTPAGTLPVLTIQSTHAGAFYQGQTGATYTLTVSNGPEAGYTNGTVTVTEILPNGLTLVAMAGSGWNCSAPAEPTCTRSDALGGGFSYPAITVTVNVSATAPTQLTNQASVSGGGGTAAQAEDFTLISGFLEATPGMFAFSYQIGGSAPLAQPLALTVSGGVLSFTATPSTQSGGNWLTVSPAGGSTPANLSVSVNPAGLAVGTYSGTITLTAFGASNSPVVLPVTLTVSELTITTTSLATGQVGVFYSQTLAATGGTGALTWSVSFGRLPNGLSLNPSTGVISGTPTSTYGGFMTFQVTDSGSPAQTATANLTMTIQLQGPLSITTTSLPNAQVGVAYSQAVSATGGTGPYAWSASGLPAYLSINAVIGTITGTPATAGTSTVSVTAMDSGSPQQTVTRNFSLTVLSSAGPLTIATTSLATGQVGIPYSQTLAATGGTGALTWSVTFGRLPNGLALNPSTGVISGTPASTYGGFMTFQVTDSGSPPQTATVNLTMTVN